MNTYLGDGLTSPSPRHRVLMIACAFPPTGGVGVLRALKFAKLLPQWGWTPVVWSGGEMPGLPRDESLLGELPPAVEQHVLPVANPQARLERWLSVCQTWPAPLPRLADGLAWRMGRLLGRARSLCFPDDQVWWARHSYRRLLQLVEEHPVDAIWSTFSPGSNHLLAMWVQQATGLPWIADFRDLWTDDGEVAHGSAWRRARMRKLERRVLQAATAVTATDRTVDLLADKVPSQRNKFHLVPNGVDPEDFAGLPSHPWPRSDGKFRLTFAGQFRATRVTPAYFDGLARFVARDPERAETFELRVVGSISQQMQEQARSAGVNLVATGHVSHREALAEMQQADLLLLSTACRRNAEHVIPAKTYEYLAAGRPILVVGDPASDVVQLVEQLGAGAGVEREAGAIAEALSEYWEAWQAGELPGGCEAAELPSLSRQAAAGQLAELLAQLTATAPFALPEVAADSLAKPVAPVTAP